MTIQEIKNTPEIVDFMLDKSVIEDSRMKLHKRLEEICELAIKALEQEPCKDTISRQAAITGVINLWADKPFGNPTLVEIKDCIEALQPAQPPCNQLTTDCISRQAVLEQINCWIGSGEYRYTNATYYLTRRMQSISPVTPQPKIGHWIMKHRTHNAVKHYTGQDEMGETHTISVLERYDVNEPYCSECGKLAGDTSQDYCCACGAKMVEPQEGEVQNADSN